jgi:branched-chain amino acid transport system substrate-binding protein
MLPRIITTFWIVIFTIFNLNLAVSEPVNAKQNTDDGTIRIGFMVSENPDTDPLSREAIDAAHLAVNQVNDKGGINGLKVELIIRASDGDWGASSIKSVELIYDEDVHAIVGSLEGRDAHLVEMAIAKAHIIYLETRATDPTLSEANLPWFFRVLPSDRQQGEKLIREIFERRQINDITLVYTDDYDEQMSANMFLRLLRDAGLSTPAILTYDKRTPEFDEVIKSLNSTDAEGIVYIGKPVHLEAFMDKLVNSGVDLPVFTPLASLQAKNNLNSVTSVCPEYVLLQKELPIKESFVNRYGYEPGIIAAYSYDGIRVLLEAIKNIGTETESLQKELSRISFPGGLTGQIEFDENGDIIDNTVICN